jgi:hypothetical protein
LFCSAVLFFQFLFSPSNSFASDPWADTAYFVYEPPNSGYGSGHFPGNVCGPPDSNATECVPTNDPKEIRSLGTGGILILEFNDNSIIDEPGPDFTVFENPFFILCTTTVVCDTVYIFAETGIISVSQDGDSFIQFPYDSVCWEGLAGVTPTTGENPLDPTVSGGDAFDLADVGLSWASYVRIQDAANLVKDKGEDFELDAVVAVHSGPAVGIEEKERNPVDPLYPRIRLEQNFPNPFRNETIIRYAIPDGGRLSVYNLSGQRIFSTLLSPENHVIQIQGEALPDGFYFYEIRGDNWKVRRKMLRIR